MNTTTLDQARLAKTHVGEIFRRFGQVAGVGLTKFDHGYAVKINLVTATNQEALPTEVDGVPVRVEVVGAIRKRPA
jgi:hypothetical protein